ncbi:hypothetical protein EI94DRAFT_1714236 [Lactarius quietus]|nr:hypothetical protein EI94DRAFT_1714236 [Lactarius quietus]
MALSTADPIESSGLIVRLNRGDGLVLRTKLVRDLLHNRAGASDVIRVRLPRLKKDWVPGVTEPALVTIRQRAGGGNTTCPFWLSGAPCKSMISLRPLLLGRPPKPNILSASLHASARSKPKRGTSVGVEHSLDVEQGGTHTLLFRAVLAVSRERKKVKLL